MSASFNTASTTTANNSVSTDSVPNYTISVPPPLNQRQDLNILSQEDRNMLMQLAPTAELERWFIGTAPIPIHISAPPTEELNDYANMELVYPGQLPAPSSIYRPAPTPTPSALDKIDPPAQRVFSPRPVRFIDIQALQDIGKSSTNLARSNLSKQTKGSYTIPTSYSRQTRIHRLHLPFYIPRQFN